MKTKSLFIAAIVVISSVMTVAGKDEPRKTGFAVVPVKGSEVFKVIYKGETSGKVRLNIYNATGTVIYSQAINGVDGFICPVNFAGLESGEYTIELVDAFGKRSEKVAYQPKKNTNYIHISRINADDATVLVAVSSTGKDEVNVKIFDNNNNLLHDQSTAVDRKFAQVYKVAAGAGSYTFQVTDNSGNTKTVKF